MGFTWCQQDPGGKGANHIPIRLLLDPNWSPPLHIFSLLTGHFTTNTLQRGKCPQYVDPRGFRKFEEHVSLNPVPPIINPKG
eukprot:587551-Pyramimonas_sp.AAC.1